jgi:hypothetical protein
MENGDRFEAPNKVYPGNPAIRYEHQETGRFIVRDEVSHEILQISEERFAPNEIQ